jgi:hypothetical protein
MTAYELALSSTQRRPITSSVARSVGSALVCASASLPGGRYGWRVATRAEVGRSLPRA